jgi:dinuclear metal center YbgI/SA1388 family protein
VEFAKARGAQLLLAHHPLFFNPLESITARDHVGKTALALAASGIAFVAAHTNWDSAQGGINDALAQRLSLINVVAFGGAAGVKRLKVVVFVPEGDVEHVIDAASRAGAGMIGLYARCASWSASLGTYRADESANPAIGIPGQVSVVPEARLEMILPAALQGRVDMAIRRVHRYEEPAIDYYPLADYPEQPAGRVGDLGAPLSLQAFASQVDQTLGTRTWTWGQKDRPIKRIALVGGAADGEWQAARAAGADVFLTGEVRQHIALEAVETGLAIMAAGHFATEHPGCAALQSRLQTQVPDVEWLLFEPGLGEAGRPF